MSKYTFEYMTHALMFTINMAGSRILLQCHYVDALGLREYIGIRTQCLELRLRNPHGLVVTLTVE